MRHREQILACNLDIVRHNLPLLDRFFAGHADLFSWVRPIAGPICFPRVARDMDVEAFCREIVEGCGVLLVPGTLYDVPGHIRTGFGRQNMPEALAHLEAYLTERGTAGAE